MEKTNVCPICHELMKIEYACGEYFANCTGGCPAPACFHSSEEPTRLSWEDWAEWYVRHHTAPIEVDNKALSLTELKQMDGAPVWVVSPFETIPTGWWLVYKCHDGTISLCGVDRAVNEYEWRRARSPILFYRQRVEEE